MKTLVSLGYVNREGETYKINSRIFEQFLPIFKKDMLGRIAEPILQSLSRQIKEYVVLVVNKDSRRHVVAQVSYNNEVMVNPSAMEHKLFYATSTGRLMLARLDENGLGEYVKKNGLPGGDWDEINTLNALKKETAKLRKQGVAAHELSDGQIKSFAVPVLGPDKKVMAVLGSYLPVQRLRQKKESWLIDSLKEAGLEISQHIGFTVGEEEAGRFFIGKFSRS